MVANGIKLKETQSEERPHGKHMFSIFYYCFPFVWCDFFFLIFSSEALGIEAFILHGGELTCRKTRLLCPKGSQQKANTLISKISLQSPSHFLHCPLARSVGWILNHTHETGKGAEVVPRSRAMIAGICTESTIPTRGKETQPFGLTPDIILYRNRTINIYI